MRSSLRVNHCLLSFAGGFVNMLLVHFTSSSCNARYSMQSLSPMNGQGRQSEAFLFHTIAVPLFLYPGELIYSGEPLFLMLREEKGFKRNRAVRA
jgi:hypothetical protein